MRQAISLLRVGSCGARAGFRTGIPAPRVPSSSTRGIQDNEPITVSEPRHSLRVFLNTDPQTTTPSPENEPGIENDPPPMVCTFRLFP